jgi:ArsR family transcriptional regulator, arsenate/arsenite/antimonite-responsive transcriptional repressor
MNVDMLPYASTSVNMYFMADDPIMCGPDCCVFVAPLDDEEADRLAALLKALADPTRVKLVSMLATAPTGELCACDLPLALGKSQPTTSHHLKLLTDVGLVEREQRGKWAWFRLRHDRLAALRAALGEGTTPLVPA